MKNFIRYGVSAIGGMLIGAVIAIVACINIIPMIQGPNGVIGLYLVILLAGTASGAGFGYVWNQWLNKRGWY